MDTPQPPSPAPADSPSGLAAPPTHAVEDIATGQKLIILALLVNIAGAVLVSRAGLEWAALGLVAFGLALIGLLRLSSGLGYTSAKRTFLAILLLIPVVSLVTLAIVNAEATRALRAAGYKVGLLGATKQGGTR